MGSKEEKAIADAFSFDSDPGFNDLVNLLGVVKLSPVTHVHMYQPYVPLSLSCNARIGYLRVTGPHLVIISDEDVLTVSGSDGTNRTFTLNSK